MSKVTEPALAQLAVAVIERPHDVDVKVLSDVAGRYFCEALGLSEDVAREDGRRFVEVMAKRSGVFIQRGNSCDFVHPTFRDYLAARAYVRKWEFDLESQASAFIKTHWRDIAIRGALLFILSLLSDQGVDVSDLLEPITRLPQHARFSGLALVEGVTANEGLSNYIVDHLLDLARAGTRWEAVYAFSLLGQLQGNQRAVDGLLILSYDDNVESWKQIRAGEALRNLGEGEKLLAFAQNTGVGDWQRLKAVEVLVELGQTDEAARGYLGLALNEEVDFWTRAKATEALGRIDRCDDLLRLSRDTTLDVGIRIQVVKTLAGLNLATELRELTQDVTVGDPVRLAVAQELWQLDQRDDSTNTFLTLARAETVAADVRLSAAEALGRQGHVGEAVSILLTMANHVTATDDTREQVAKVLMDLGQVNEVVPILSGMVGGAEVDASMRVWAAFSLSELKQRGETVQACLMLALDEALESDIRVEATRALQRLGRASEAAEAYRSLIRTAQELTEMGRIDDSASILVALASDGAVDVGERERATFMLWQLDRKYEAAQACLALVCDKSLAFDMRRDAADALERMGFLNEAIQARDVLIRDTLMTEGAPTYGFEIPAELVQPEERLNAV
jgi:tetratricopeptide (TPR) repeat protein